MEKPDFRAMGVSHHSTKFQTTFAAEVILHVSGALDDRFDELSGPRCIASVALWFRTGGCSVQVLKP